MPYGSRHGHVFKETNSQPEGREGGKTSTHMGPAASGSVKANVKMTHGLGRSPRGKTSAPKAKQTRGRY